MSSQEIVSPFVTSSYSGGGSANECVEVARTADGGRAVRDSKNPEVVQFYTPSGWSVFLEGVKGGEFDN
ncbi:DUF397 domain-containing protein [Streptomyces sp. NPDC001339]|uniref:DUF397 domain-containing protein n=1 Tax=Streptomyces sp. NPDC001339 TaxID=3364563 RepID=UPI0036C932C1